MVRTDSLGQTYTLTGLQAYVSVNQNRSTIGSSGLSDAPAFALPDAAIVANVAPDASTGVINLNFTPPAAGEFLLVYMSRPVSAGINFLPKSAYKLVAVLDSTATSPEDLGSQYVTRFGTIVGKDGERIFTRVIRVSADGFAATPVQTIGLIVP